MHVGSCGRLRGNPGFTGLCATSDDTNPKELGITHAAGGGLACEAASCCMG